jgi:hypothetical protein
MCVLLRSFALLLLACYAAVARAGPKDEIKAAILKLANSENYSWTLTSGEHPEIIHTDPRSIRLNLRSVRSYQQIYGSLILNGTVKLRLSSMEEWYEGDDPSSHSDDELSSAEIYLNGGRCRPFLSRLSLGHQKS